MHQWMHLICPSKFQTLPQLFCAGTETANSPAYRHDQSPWKDQQRCVFQYTLEGYGLIDYHGTTYKVDRGKAFIFFKNISEDTCYYYPPNETQPWSFVYCEFSNFKEAVEELNTRQGPVYDFGEESLVVKKLMKLLESQKQEDKMISDFESYEICVEIVGEMCRLVELKDNDSLAITARNMIYKQRLEDLSLPEISKHLGVSPGHLWREFKQHFNSTPKHYHDQLRMQAIAERLRNSGQPIKEIAREFGFEDISNFNKFFKKHHSSTPGQFRRDYPSPRK